MFDNIISVITALGSLATAISLIFLIRQTFLLKRTYEYTTDWQCKEKAAQLALYYKENILSNISYVNAVLKVTDALSLLNNIRTGDINQFTNDELESLVGTQIFQRMEQRIKSPENLLKLLFVRSRLKTARADPFPNQVDTRISTWIQQKVSGTSPATPEMKDIDVLDAIFAEFIDTVSDMLNSLEYFAMNFTTGVADESVVFQSLHQTYLQIVRALYWHVACQNSSPKDKFYTHVITLYHIWAKRDEENGKKANSALHTAAAVRK